MHSFARQRNFLHGPPVCKNTWQEWCRRSDAQTLAFPDGVARIRATLDGDNPLNRYPLAALAAALLYPLAAAAQGSNTTLSRAGGWTAYAATSNDGLRLCGMEARGEAEGRQLHIKYFQNSPRLSFQAMRTSWNVPQGARMPVNFQIDENRPWNASASGSPGTPTTGGIVEWTIEGDSISAFERQFRAGRKLRVSFPGGSEAPWIVSLIGTNAMVSQFVGCMRSINAGSGGGGGPPPTANPGPTQPFVPRATPKFPEDGQVPTTR